MPLYTYRREDGSVFEIRQRFSDEALAVCPDTGQQVTRLVQAAGIIFKGSGFYVNDSKKSANGKKGKSAERSGEGAADKGKKEAPAAEKKDAPVAAKGEKAASGGADN